MAMLSDELVKWFARLVSTDDWDDVMVMRMQFDTLNELVAVVAKWHEPDEPRKLTA